MGAKAQILLVIGALLLTSGAGAGVNAAHYQAFWLWSGVTPTPEMKNAHTVYLHQGEINAGGNRVTFQKMGLPVSKLHFPALWLTVRFTTLDVPTPVLQRLARLLENWRNAGNQVTGLQVDFDAATQRLDLYAAFLHRLRAEIPRDYALGVTGLLDWAKTGEVDVINALPVDELVVQTYQGRKTVTQYADYLPALNKIRIPFKIGVVQHGEWDEQRAPLHSRWYRGTVVFMLTPRQTGILR